MSESNEAVQTSATTETAATEVQTQQATEAGNEQPSSVDETNLTEPNAGLSGEDEEGSEGDETSEPAELSIDNLEIEGFDVDQPTAEAFAKLAKEAGVSQEGFEKLYKGMMPYMAQRQAEQLNELRASFLEDCRNDPEIGGAKWKQSLSSARQAFKKFVDPDTQMILQASGLDCHPGLIKCFATIQQLISNDAVVRGTTASKRDPAKAFFNNSNMN